MPFDNEPSARARRARDQTPEPVRTGPAHLRDAEAWWWLVEHRENALHPITIEHWRHRAAQARTFAAPVATGASRESTA